MLHWFTSEKGVHQFSYFLPLMPPMAGGVRIGAHFNTNAYTYDVYMHEQTTTGFGVCISGRKYLNWCTPFSDVSQGLHLYTFYYVLLRVSEASIRPSVSTLTIQILQISPSLRLGPKNHTYAYAYSVCL